MSFNIIDDASSSTLTVEERAAEAKRILSRIGERTGSNWTSAARLFVEQKRAELELWERVEVTVKQLWWLRELAGQVD